MNVLPNKRITYERSSSLRNKYHKRILQISSGLFPLFLPAKIVKIRKEGKQTRDLGRKMIYQAETSKEKFAQPCEEGT